MVVIIGRHKGDVKEFPKKLEANMGDEKYMIKKEKDESVISVLNKLREQTDVNLNGLGYAEGMPNMN